MRRLCDAKIIVPLRFSNWLANLVPVRKKSGEIRLCVDFINLNKAYLKGNYPLPKMDHVVTSPNLATYLAALFLYLHRFIIHNYLTFYMLFTDS